MMHFHSDLRNWLHTAMIVTLNIEPFSLVKRDGSGILLVYV